MFQSTRPAGGATYGHPRDGGSERRFNPRAPRGARHRVDRRHLALSEVSIHAPRGGRDRLMDRPEWRRNRFNPRAPRGARRYSRRQCLGEINVSIHAPRGGRDPGSAMEASWPEGFNPRAPRGARRHSQSWAGFCRCFNPRAPRGARRRVRRGRCAPQVFQSTRPAGGATRLFRRLWRPTSSFNPRAPRGARLGHPRTHAKRSYVFQSTRPAGGATIHDGIPRCIIVVSIHAPRGGRDRDGGGGASGISRFNPRAPRGARLFTSSWLQECGQFQSTRPAGGATWDGR